LTLKNTSSANAFVLTARHTGAAGNQYSAAVINQSGQDYLVIYQGTTTLQSIPIAPGDLNALATTVNAMNIPVQAAAVGAAPLALTSARHLAGGTAGKAGKLWFKIVVPARPLNRRGWIPASSVRVKKTIKSIVVNRSTHYLEVFKYGKRVFRTRVATGRPDRPTPRGLFYIAAKYHPPENAAVTAYALELSAPAGLPDFAFGGVIGIHGTPITSSLGHNASNGCIRVSASAARQLKQLIPLGTPVRVTG
jgi:hypothetical protein